jgi:cysteine synthase
MDHPLEMSDCSGLKSATGSAPLPVPPAFDALACLIGNTPLFKVRVRYRGVARDIYAKAEHLNLTGSIKDRMALHILRCAYQTGQLRAGDLITEATSGNTGIAFSALGRALGHEVVIFMPDWMSRERQILIQSLGARIELVSHEQGGFLGSIALTESLASKSLDSKRVFLPRQFSNCANLEAHESTTGPEISAQLASMGLQADAFVAGVGTGGTIMGVARHLKRANPNVRVHPMEPSESPTMSTGFKVGKHRIQGISDEFIPEICELKKLDAIIAVSDGDAIIMAQRLAQELGLPVGISSGANLLAALKVQDEIGADKVVATIFCDDNKKYLSTDLFKSEPIKPSYLSPHVELLSFECIPRLAQPVAVL